MNPALSVALWVLGKVAEHLIRKYSQMTPEQKAQLKKALAQMPSADPDDKMRDATLP